MRRHTELQSNIYILFPLLLGLLVVLACGADATATRTATQAPTATRAPAAPTPTSAPTAKPTLTRLVVGMVTNNSPGNLTWARGQTDLIDTRPAMDHLIGQDRVTGAFTPQLALTWENTPDAKTFTFTLRKGVPFHEGKWGEFTAKDVRHAMFLINQPDSFSPDIAKWRALTGLVKEDSPETIARKVEELVEIVDPYKVVFHLKTANPEFLALVSLERAVSMESKARWDAGGVELYKTKYVGTGPFEMVERRGDIVLHQRVDNHWRHTPEFRELEARPIAEDTTRMAALLTEEVHLAPLPETLLNIVEARGMKILASKQISASSSFQFGGLYFATPELVDPTLPWIDIRVRQAMNMAIDRKSINKNLFAGKAAEAKVFVFHPTKDEALSPGTWNPRWEKEFDEKYGYNPTRAKELLAEAGFPNGFEFDFLIVPTTTPGHPEASIVAAQAFEAIGLRPKLADVERRSVSQRYRQKKLSGIFYYNGGGSARSMDINRIQFGEPGVVHAFTHPDIQAKIDAIGKTAVLAERTRLVRETGDYFFDNFVTVPMFLFFKQIAVNPKFISEYIYQGNAAGTYTHLGLIKLAK